MILQNYLLHNTALNQYCSITGRKIRRHRFLKTVKDRIRNSSTDLDFTPTDSLQIQTYTGTMTKSPDSSS